MVWLSLTVLFLAVAIHPGNPRKGDGGDLVLTNLATKSTVPLSEKMLENENVYGDVDCGTDREKVPIKTGKVEFKGPPVNVVLSFIRYSVTVDSLFYLTFRQSRKCFLISRN